MPNLSDIKTPRTVSMQGGVIGLGALDKTVLSGAQIDAIGYGVGAGGKTFEHGAEKTLTVVSTDGADGAQMKVVGIDASGNFQEETFILNGLTPVIGTKLWRYVNRSVILPSVSALTLNLGDISIGFTAAGVADFMPKQVGVSAVPQFMIPADFGRNWWCRSFHTSITKASGAGVEFAAQLLNLDSAGNGSVHNTHRWTTGVGGPNGRIFESMISLSPGMIIGMVANGNDAIVTDVTAEMVLIRDAGAQSTPIPGLY